MTSNTQDSGISSQPDEGQATTAAAPTAIPTKAPAVQPGGSPSAVRIDDSGAHVCYANFCRVTGTPEELIIDCGLNSQPAGTPTEAIEIKQRVIVNYFTAKRMLHALHLSVQRHEQAFGVLETDVQKRVVTQRRAPAG